jgi:hypothetical protein
VRWLKIQLSMGHGYLRRGMGEGLESMTRRGYLVVCLCMW